VISAGETRQVFDRRQEPRAPIIRQQLREAAKARYLGADDPDALR